MNQQKQLAVLIDADNASSAQLDKIMNQVAKFGQTKIKRAYGDWTMPNLANWKDILLSHLIVPIQQFAYTKGKNATDSCLIIDAMDLLYTGRFDGFCLVSSDSDFTRLATCIREQGLVVYGFGKKQTPQAFVEACTQFLYVDGDLEKSKLKAQPPQKPDPKKEQPKEQKPKESKPSKPKEQPPKAQLPKEQPKKPTPVIVDSSAKLPTKQPSKLIDDAIELIKSAIKELANEQGLANISPVKTHVLRTMPNFDTKQLSGHKKFSTFLQAYPEHFDLQKQEGGACLVKARAPS